MKVQYLALLLVIILIAGTVPFLPQDVRESKAIREGDWQPDPYLPYKDTDNDGLPDVWEYKYLLDHNDATDRDDDSDGDGYDIDGDGEISVEEMFTNFMEFENGTNPKDPDTDQDKMYDLWEIVHGLDPLFDDSAMDRDNDTLSNLEEYRRGTDPTDPDSDDDDLLDGYKVDNGNRTDPLDPDTDGDGMTDGWEVHFGLAPLDSADADGDPDGDSFDANLTGSIEDDELFSNLMEFMWGTDPTSNDTDGDGMPDGYEFAFGLDPTDPSDAYFDGDNDSLSNVFEYENPVDTDGITWTEPDDPDTDGDGLLDGFEVLTTTTDPTNIDTDGDLMPDGWEFKFALDPANASDINDDSDNDSYDADRNGLIEGNETYGALAEFLNGTSPDGRDRKPVDGILDGWDSDGDGIPDGWEVYWGFDPTNASDMKEDLDMDGPDIDGDGAIDLNFTNLDEFLADTDPLDNDTDMDGMFDGWEDHWGLDPLRDDSMWDFDNDTYDVDGEGNITDDERLTNIEEYLLGTSPSLPDSDGDGINDTWENYYGLDPTTYDPWLDSDEDGYDYNGNGTIDWNETFTNMMEFLNATDPTNPDTDGDGLIDGWEVYYGFDPHNATDGNADFDNDGFDNDRSGTIDPDEEYTNWMEYLNGTNIYDNDTDGDGLPDGWEVYYGLDPLFAQNATHDFDIDGLPDVAEFRNPILSDTDGYLSTDPTSGDTDGDGIPDGEEVEAGSDGYITDPTNNDTDGDGMPDGWEVDWGFDPTDPSDADGDADNDGYDVDGNGTIEQDERFTNLMEYLNGTLPNATDTDGDSMSDGWESFNGMDPTDPADGAYDNDNDGYDFDGSGTVEQDEWYTNAMEFLNGTRPDVKDTDGDGMIDGWEAYWGFDPLVNDSSSDTDPSRGRLRVRGGNETVSSSEPAPGSVTGVIDSGDHKDIGELDGVNASSRGNGIVHQMYRLRWVIPSNPDDNDCVNDLNFSVGFSISMYAGGKGGMTVKLYDRVAGSWDTIGFCPGEAGYSGGYTASMAWMNVTISRDVTRYLDSSDDLLLLLSSTSSGSDGAIVTDYLNLTIDYVGDGMPAWQEHDYGIDPMDWDSDGDGIPDGAEV